MVNVNWIKGHSGKAPEFTAKKYLPREREAKEI
jgi:hypothetical protein